MAGSHGLCVLLACGQEEMAQAIRAKGHEVHAACDPRAAVTTARAFSLDVAILDMEECGDPFSLARDVRAASPWHKPMCIGLTRSAGGSCEECCRAAGIDLLLFKPVKADRIAELVGSVANVVEDYLSFDPMI